MPVETLAMSSKAHCPQPWGERVGGVSGEPTRVNEVEQSTHVLGRNGERHPGLQDAVSLRGLAEERMPWSVRIVCKGLVPVQSYAPMTTGVLWKNEEGNVVSVRQAHALFAGAQRLTNGPADEDTSFARSRDPCTSIVTKLVGRKLGGVMRRLWYRGRASPRKWE